MGKFLKIATGFFIAAIGDIVPVLKNRLNILNQMLKVH